MFRTVKFPVRHLRPGSEHVAFDRPRRFHVVYARGARLGGYDCEPVKACCVAADLPVIDSGMVAFEDVVRLAVSRPMPAAGDAPNSPPHAFSDAPLAVLANAYRAAGAEVLAGP